MSISSGKTEKEQLTVNDIRYNNKVNLFTDIVNSAGVTKNDLAIKNNISIMTVKNIVDELLEMVDAGNMERVNEIIKQLEKDF